MARDKNIYYNAPAELYVKALLGEHNDSSFEDILNVTIAKRSQEGMKWDDIQKELHFSGGNEQESIRKGNRLITDYRGSSYFGCESDTFWDYRNNVKNEEQRVLLIAYLALKSIIGKDRAYCHMTNDYWLSRMSGYAGLAPEIEVPDKTIQDTREVRRKVDDKWKKVTEPYTRTLSKKKVKKYHPVIQKYSSHYRLQKVKALLYDYYHIATYSNTRGFYASWQLELEGLMEKVFEHRAGQSQHNSLMSDTKRIEEKIRERMAAKMEHGKT